MSSENESEVADFDAFFTEQAQGPRSGTTLRLYGRDYVLPTSLPMMFALQMERVKDSDNPRRHPPAALQPCSVRGRWMSGQRRAWTTGNTRKPGTITVAEAAELYASRKHPRMRAGRERHPPRSRRRSQSLLAHDPDPLARDRIRPRPRIQHHCRAARHFEHSAFTCAPVRPAGRSSISPRVGADISRGHRPARNRCTHGDPGRSSSLSPISNSVTGGTLPLVTQKRMCPCPGFSAEQGHIRRFRARRLRQAGRGRWRCRP